MQITTELISISISLLYLILYFPTAPTPRPLFILLLKHLGLICVATGKKETTNSDDDEKHVSSHQKNKYLEALHHCCKRLKINPIYQCLA